MILNKDKVKEQIEKRICADVACGKVGGAAAIVKQNGEVVYKGFFGSAGEGREITEKSLFRLASMTKPVTTVAILKQIERGLVSLDDLLEKYIPEYADMEIGALDENNNLIITGKAKNKITVKNLLSHSSGVASGPIGGVLDKLTAHAQTDLKSITDAYAHLPIAFEPSSSQAYSGMVAFDLLARIVEITSGLTFDKFLEKEVFEPIGMCDTTFMPTEEQWSRMVCLHTYTDGVASFMPVDTSTILGGCPLTYFCGGASLTSTPADYQKFADMLLSGGKTEDGGRILSEESIKLMATPAFPYEIGWKEKWGLGVRVIAGTGNRLPEGSFGWSGSFGCHFWIDPANNITAIYMKNSTYDGGSGATTAANFELDVYS